MPRQDTTLETEGAEFLVLGNLLIEGIPAYKTYTNLRGYDLVATGPESRRSARIQVKSRWATNANRWLIKNVDECDFLVLALLRRGHRWTTAAKQELPREEPEYYVLSAGDAKSLIVTTGWPRIRFQKKNFEKYRRKWGRTKTVLKIHNHQVPTKAK